MFVVRENPQARVMWPFSGQDKLRVRAPYRDAAQLIMTSLITDGARNNRLMSLLRIIFYDILINNVRLLFNLT